MNKNFISVIILLITSFLFAQYQAVGSDSTVDVLTWNIENFPKNGITTINEVANIISDLDVDLIAVQEIADTSSFNQLSGQLTQWDGLLSTHVYGDDNYQKVGILYDSDKVTVHSWQLLFEDDGYAFPRPPLEVNLTVAEDTLIFDLRMIILHLKAFDDADNIARRRLAMEQLKDYMDDEILNGAEDDFILLGDYNDHVENAMEDNIFYEFLAASNGYEILTEPLAGEQGSYIGLNEPNLIDHILISADALDEYGENGDCEVLYLDQQNSSYESIVSDHRPVFARFTFENKQTSNVIPIAELYTNFEQYQGQTVTIRGVVTVPPGVFSQSFTSAYVQDESNAGINVYQSESVIQGIDRGMRIEVTGELIDYRGLHEIVYQDHTVLAANQSLPLPIEISTRLITDTDAEPGRWVTVQGVIETISSPPHIEMEINDGSGTGALYFDPDAGLDVSNFTIGESIRVTGVKTVYNYTGQVQPAYRDDIEKLPPSAIVNFIEPEISKNTFKVYPNPFNAVTTITYTSEWNGALTFSIYTLNGRLVHKITRQIQANELFRYHWQGIDQAGRSLASGIYLCKLDLNNRTIVTSRLLLVK